MTAPKNFPSYVDYGKPGRDPQWDTLEMQNRIIIRLRAALRTLGKTSEEIDAIARDADGNV